MFVIVRTNGKYVAPPGQEHSYTDRLEDAWVFRTREDAERNRCPGNECVLRLESLLSGLTCQ